MNLIQTAWQIARANQTFIKYSVIGVMGATLDFATFAVLTTHLNFPYLIANLISATLGIINNFILNWKFNFKVTDKIFKRFLSFYLIGTIGIGISSGLLYLLIDILKINALFSKLLTIAVVVAIQYTYNKKVTFAQKEIALENTQE